MRDNQAAEQDSEDQTMWRTNWVFFFVAFLNHKVQSVALTAEDVGSEGAAGDPEVVGVILFVELLHVQVPQSQVSVGGSAHKHLTARAEGAGHHRCVLHRSGPL